MQSLISDYEEKAQPLDGGEAAKNEFARSMLEEKIEHRMKIKARQNPGQCVRSQDLYSVNSADRKTVRG